MRTGDLEKALGVSGETIRSWTGRFQRFLSSGAQGIGTRQRMYAADDYLVLATVAELSGEGFGLDAIEKRLAEGYRVDDPSAATVGYSDGRMVPAAVVEQVIDASEKAAELELVKAERDKLAAALERLQVRLETMEAERRQEVQHLTEQREVATKALNDEIKRLLGEIAELKARLGGSETEARMLREYQEKRRRWF